MDYARRMVVAVCKLSHCMAGVRHGKAACTCAALGGTTRSSNIHAKCNKDKFQVQFMNVNAKRNKDKLQEKEKRYTAILWSKSHTSEMCSQDKYCGQGKACQMQKPFWRLLRLWPSSSSRWGQHPSGLSSQLPWPPPLPSWQPSLQLLHPTQ